jgi:hypothetical protein
MQAPETLHLMIHKNLRSVSKLTQQIQGGNKKKFFFYNSVVVKQHNRQTTPMQIGTNSNSDDCHQSRRYSSRVSHKSCTHRPSSLLKIGANSIPLT